MKYKLYDDMKNYCEENKCWKARNTVKDWNEILGTDYKAATFTALVNTGLIIRTVENQWINKSPNVYYLAPTEEMIEAEKKRDRERKIENAKYYVEHYEEEVANYQARYAEMLKSAEEYLARETEWYNKKLAEAKEILNIE